MITEDYVSFEIAKLLKEKRYCNVSTIFYKENGELIHHKVPLNNNGISDTLGVFYEAPTLQMAMKWLREVHNLVIQIELIDFLEHGEVWLYSVTDRKIIKQLTGRDEDFTEHSYEEACEAAIKYCLENLI